MVSSECAHPIEARREGPVNRRTKLKITNHRVESFTTFISPSVFMSSSRTSGPSKDANLAHLYYLLIRPVSILAACLPVCVRSSRSSRISETCSAFDVYGFWILVSGLRWYFFSARTLTVHLRGTSLLRTERSLLQLGDEDEMAGGWKVTKRHLIKSPNALYFPLRRTVEQNKHTRFL